MRKLILLGNEMKLIVPLRSGVIMTLLGFLLFAACATGKTPISKFGRIDKKFGEFTKHMDESLFKVTDNRLYSIELLLIDGNLTVGRNDFDIVIHDNKDNDVEGAELEIVSSMPTGGIEASPKIKGTSVPGLYSIENLNLAKAGQWELLIRIKKDGKKDSVVFDFPDIL
jgi:hypothetical protein